MMSRRRRGRRRAQPLRTLRVHSGGRQLVPARAAFHQNRGSSPRRGCTDVIGCVTWNSERPGPKKCLLNRIPHLPIEGNSARARGCAGVTSASVSESRSPPVARLADVSPCDVHAAAARSRAGFLVAEPNFGRELLDVERCPAAGRLRIRYSGRGRSPEPRRSP